MTIMLKPDQQRWIEAQVAAGTLASVEDAVQLAVAGLMDTNEDEEFGCAKLLVEEARAALARGYIPWPLRGRCPQDRDVEIDPQLTFALPSPLRPRKPSGGLRFGVDGATPQPATRRARLSGVFTRRGEAPALPLEAVLPHDLAEEVEPRRIVLLGEPELPCATPAFCGALASLATIET